MRCGFPHAARRIRKIAGSENGRDQNRQENGEDRKSMTGDTIKNDVKIENDVKRATEGETADSCCYHLKSTPRDESKLRQLKNRLSRMVGQLNGIGRMLDENRYCGDVLTQVAAVESALQAFGYLILQEHMETCVVEEIQKGNTKVVEETVELIKKLK